LKKEYEILCFGGNDAFAEVKTSLSQTGNAEA